MDDYIKRSDALDAFTYEQGDRIPEVGSHGEQNEIWVRDVKAKLRSIRAADVVPVVHGTPMLRYRPQRYERYEECGLNENGEVLYLKRVFVDEKNYAMYCPACGKRLCSRFKSYCPNCGAKMDGGQNETD